MFTLPPFALLRRMTESTPFFPSSFPPPEISSFWRTSIVMTHSETQKVLPTPSGRKYSIGSSLLTSAINDPDISTLLHRSFFDISIAPSSLALSCFWEVLQDLGFDHLPIFLTVPLSDLCANECPHPSIFKKLAGMILFFISTITVPLQRNIRLFLFPLLLLSLLL